MLLVFFENRCKLILLSLYIAWGNLILSLIASPFFIDSKGQFTQKNADFKQIITKFEINTRSTVMLGSAAASVNREEQHKKTGIGKTSPVPVSFSS